MSPSATFASVSSSWLQTLPLADKDNFEFQSGPERCLWPPPHLLSATNYRNLFSILSSKSLCEYWTAPESGQTPEDLLSLKMCPSYSSWSTAFMRTHLTMIALRPFLRAHHMEPCQIACKSKIIPCHPLLSWPASSTWLVYNSSDSFFCFFKKGFFFLAFVHSFGISFLMRIGKIKMLLSYHFLSLMFTGTSNPWENVFLYK